MPVPAPVGLRCEYSVNPLGLGETRPRVSWKLADDRPGARQSAYQIQVAASESDLLAGRNLRWDSGKVASDAQLYVPLGVANLKSRDRLAWRVRSYDAAGEASAWSEPATFEMGLLQRSDWRASWIMSSIVGGARSMPPAPFFRRGFALPSAPKRARLYVTALGLYDASINGQRVGDLVFRPGWTEYRKRVQYDTFDVTPLLKAGDNAVGAILGDGWYSGHVSNLDRQTYGDRPRLLAQLEVECADGSTHTVVTDGSWRWSAGPILESDMIMGEAHDARREFAGWDAPGFDDGVWSAAVVSGDPGASLVAPVGPPVRRMMERSPLAEPVKQGGAWIFDLGQNLVGWVRLRVQGGAGKTVRLRFGEMLKPDGSLYTENLRTARATDYYTLRGDEAGETWEPRFTFHGFRYVELTGLPQGFTPTRDTVTAVVVHSDTPATGAFECSEPLLNRLQSNIQWGQRGNFLEVPTDCPQRDERLGWTGDAQVFVRTASFNADVAGFFAKWQQDIEDGQGDSGAIPPILPDPKPNFDLQPGDSGPAWSDATVICPWTIYRCFGDTRILEKHYASLQKYVAHLESISHEHIRCHFLKDSWGGFGDWLALDAVISIHFTPTPKDLIGTAYFARVVGHLADIARVLGKADDAAKYDALRSRIVEAFNREYVTPNGRVQGHAQTAYLLALAFDLLPEEKRANATAHLVKLFEWRQWHLSTGFVGTPLICPTLSRFGQTDGAYRVLLQKDYPGWLYSVLQGATTIWERWNSYSHDKGFGPVDMNSFNHYAYGAVGEWMYATIAGIDLSPDIDKPAYKHSVIRPQPGGELTWAKGSLQTPYGELSTSWRLVDGQGGRFELDVLIPPNTTATVVLPVADDAEVEASDDARRAAGATYEVPAGRHRFRAAMHAEVAV